MKRLLLLFFLASCSKEQLQPPTPATVAINGIVHSYQEVGISVAPCPSGNLYSITASKGNEVFLISLVTDSLRTGTYECWYNFWSPAGDTSGGITLVIGSTQYSFHGNNINGQINKP